MNATSNPESFIAGHTDPALTPESLIAGHTEPVERHIEPAKGPMESVTRYTDPETSDQRVLKSVDLLRTSELLPPLTREQWRFIYDSPFVQRARAMGGNDSHLIYALLWHIESLKTEIIKRDAIRPRRYKLSDGKFIVWHCPDEEIPIETIG